MHRFRVNVAWAVSLLSLLLAVPMVHAEAPLPGPSPTASPRPVSVEAEVGAVLTEGNTRTASGTLALAVGYRHGRFTHRGRVEGLYSEDRERTTAQRVATALKTEYRFTEHAYAFATGRYEDDRFSGVDYTVTEAAGVGWRPLPGPRLMLDLEGGPGGRHRRLEDGRREDDVIGWAATRLAWQASRSATLSEAIRVESGEDGTDTESITALETRVIGNLALKVSLTLRDRTEVPPDTRRTDTVSRVTLVYRY